MKTVNGVVGSIFAIVGVFSLAASAIIISGICAETIQASALLHVPTCDQATASFFATLLIGVVFLAIGGVVLIKGRQKGQYDSLQADIAQTERPARQTGLKLLAFGPYPLDERTIDAKVVKHSPGAYALGVKSASHFQVHFVGRSDTHLKAQLKDYVGKYPLFKFEYSDSPEAAFRKECELYHTFEPRGNLNNRHHPERPPEATWSCPHCDVLDSQALASSKAKFCPLCKAQIHGEATYCLSCGERIEEKATAQVSKEKTPPSFTAPPVREIDVWIPILWLFGIIIAGIAFGLFALLVLIAAAIYVHYNSKKFGITGDRTIFTVIIAIVELPVYANDLRKLRRTQMRHISHE